METRSSAARTSRPKKAPPDLHVIAEGIAEDFQAALEEFETSAEDLHGR
jgi:hypothetical protein